MSPKLTASPSVPLTILIWLLAAMLAALTGCTSFRSTLMHRSGDGSLHRDGCLRPLRGIPVKLKVPSHLAVSIVETYQIVPGVSPGGKSTEIEKADSTDSNPTPITGQTKARPQVLTLGEEGEPRTLEVLTKVEYSDQVFLVDFPRPLAGVLDLTNGKDDGITFDGEQYFAKIRGSIDDRTMQELGSDFGTGLFQPPGAFAAGASSAGAPTKSVPSPEIQLATRVVAYQRFDLNEAGWEERVQAFVDEHLGIAVSCSGCPPARSIPQSQPQVDGGSSADDSRVVPAFPREQF